MAGAEIAAAPVISPVEFDADKVADFAEDTIADAAAQQSIGAVDCYLGAERQGDVELEAGSGGRDILQIGHIATMGAGALPPFYFDEVGAKHSRLDAAVIHIPF